MAAMLMVKCKGCYTPFPVEEQMDEATFAAANLPMKSLPCPHCGIGRPYDKGDYFFSSGEPGGGDSPLDGLLGRS